MSGGGPDGRRDRAPHLPARRRGRCALRCGRRRVPRACAEAYARRCPADLRDRLAPGVPAALNALGARAGTLLSLVTGNLEAIARLKLERRARPLVRAGQGAFGSDAEDYAARPAIARRRAGALDGGAPYPRERTVIIGDTPRDIACARRRRPLRGGRHGAVPRGGARRRRCRGARRARAPGAARRD
ncbi:MAG TPA: haloacid dehalogenase-like hydrolase [Solirubrobacteraceae bacterium]|nr:haloacid dehalogenase-like hydrolase [Solirubrobacteraceae bacterium]